MKGRRSPPCDDVETMHSSRPREVGHLDSITLAGVWSSEERVFTHGGRFHGCLDDDGRFEQLRVVAREPRTPATTVKHPGMVKDTGGDEAMGQRYLVICQEPLREGARRGTTSEAGSEIRGDQAARV